MTEYPKIDIKVISALILVHFTGDFYASFINPLLPVFVKKYTLSMTQVGLIAGVSRLLSLLIQPPAGYIADHHRTRIFILGGPLLAMIFVSLVGVAPSFLVLILFISLGSIGQAMFHPTAAGMISTYSGAHFGFSMSLFNMGGTLAFGIGPLFIAYFVRSYGLAASPLAMAVGLPIM
ncbi:MAG: MFS transporter, partial [Desulfatiglandales bacterium]|nr:MFS transporter [Desulfatiglandales bacterium]